MVMENIKEPKKITWFTRVFEDYYIVEIYERVPTGQKTRTFHLKEIKKLTNNSLQGKLLEGNSITYSSSEPFDYYIKKIY